MTEMAITPATPGLRASAGQVTGRTWLALSGIILAVMASGIGENVSKIALTDIQGGMVLSADDASWLVASYITGFVIGSGFTPSFWPTFSLRYVAIFMCSLYILGGVATPVVSGNPLLLLLARALQGVAGGAMPPMLMTIVLRFMPPRLKVPALGAYGLVSAWSASMGATFASFAFRLGWQDYFFWNVPVMVLALVCLAHGLPQDPFKLERLKQFDRRGALLGPIALAMLTVGLYQGERFDWFNSPLISGLLAGGTLLLGLFLLNEKSQPIPFFNLQLLKNRNLSFSLITLCGVLMLMVALVSVPSAYLAAVQGLRQEQLSDLFLWVALPQLIVLPVVALLCNQRWVDVRWVLAASLALMALAAWLASHLDASWVGTQFHICELLQALAQPMAILPLLILATNGLAPTQGPFAAAWFNAVKGFAATVAGGTVALLSRQRSDFHYSVLSDQLANQGHSLDAHLLMTQSKVMASADLFLIVAVTAAVLMILIPVMPGRVFAPGIAIPLENKEKV